MKIKYRIKKAQEFQEIIQNKKSKANNTYIIYYRPKLLEHGRVGISASKKLGNAVERNKYKRQLRMILHDSISFEEINFDFIVIIRNKFITNSYEENKNMLESLIKTVTIK